MGRKVCTVSVRLKTSQETGLESETSVFTQTLRQSHSISFSVIVVVSFITYFVNTKHPEKYLNIPQCMVFQVYISLLQITITNDIHSGIIRSKSECKNEFLQCTIYGFTDLGQRATPSE